MAAPRANIGDEEVLDWWTLYDAGRTLDEIAFAYGRQPVVVWLALHNLGVLEPTRVAEKSTSPSSVSGKPYVLPETLGERDEAIIGALRKLASLRAEGDGESRRHLPVARALPHVKPVIGRHPMSARQRSQDAMSNPGVREELCAAGLLPFRARIVGRYWN